MLICLCQVRDITHTNLNPYIGVCVTCPNISIISHYCYRGSLEVRKFNITIYDSVFKISM